MNRICALLCGLVVALWGVTLWGQEPRGVLYDFNATWCGPCQQMKPLVEKLAREGLPIKAVDVDQYKSFADQYKISSIPAFVLVVDGKEVDRHVGAMSEAELRRMVAKIPTARPVSNVNQQSPGNAQGGMPVQLGEPAPFRDNAPVNIPNAETRMAEADNRRGLLDRLPFGRREEKPEVPEVVRGNDDVLASAGPFDTKPVSVAAVDPMLASVRIRVVTNGQVAKGSGTIVQSAEGLSRILTCAHLFEKATADSRIEVDVFEKAKAQPTLGTLLQKDVKADLALISINTTKVLPASTIATAVQAPKVNDAVCAIGCDGGNAPTREDIKVTDIDKYEEPHNLLCTGLPVQGRSGGGLFDKDGRVVGVCSGADEQDKRGFYSGLLAIHAFLDRLKLTDLYQPKVEPKIETPQNLPSRLAEVPVREKPADSFPKVVAAPAPMDLEAGDAEIVVIMRSKAQPNAQNRVIIIHEASDKFMAYLSDELPPYESANLQDTRHAVQPASAPAIARALNRPVDSMRVASQPLNKSRVVPTTLTQPEVAQRYVRSASAK